MYLLKKLRTDIPENQWLTTEGHSLEMAMDRVRQDEKRRLRQVGLVMIVPVAIGLGLMIFASLK